MPDPEVEMEMIYERLKPHMRDAFTRVLKWHLDSQFEVDKKAVEEFEVLVKEALVLLEEEIVSAQLEASDYKKLYEDAAVNVEKLTLEVLKLKQELWRLKPEVSQKQNGDNHT